MCSLGLVQELECSDRLVELPRKAVADYTVTVRTRLDGGGRPSVVVGRCSGRYRLGARSGRARTVSVEHPGEHGADEAEYLTMAAALQDVRSVIGQAGRDPREFTVRLRSSRDLLVRQLTGEWRARRLEEPGRLVRGLLVGFRAMDVLWVPAREIAREMRRS